MKHTVNAMGLACPLPVVNTKAEMEKMNAGESVLVMVDNEIAVQNLEKFAGVRGHGFASQKKSPTEYHVTLTKGGEIASDAQEEAEIVCEAPKRRALVVLSSAQMGQGEEALGRALMKSFIFALTKQDELPETILLYNSGAFLSCEGSESVEDLRYMAGRGVEVLTCGTCLNFYGLTEKLAVGGVTNMYDIVEKMERAGTIIRP